MTKDRRFLLAVNAGSNDISVLAVTPLGLKITDKASSGGVFPAILAEHHGVVYVVNEGKQPNPNTEPNGLSTMKGFLLDKEGKLQAIPGSTRTIGGLGSDPADIVFSPDGDLWSLPRSLQTSLISSPCSATAHSEPHATECQ